MLKMKVPAEMQEIERAGHLAIVEACIEHDVDRAEAELQAHLGVFENIVTFELAAPDGEPQA
jgi:DNA-binding GntR family transcriptional regulator